MNNTKKSNALQGNKNEARKERRNNENLEIEKKSALCQVEIDTSTIETFDDFPISSKTLKGLQDSGFSKPTDIQKDGIALALRGLDVLAAAKTGSGKTLAFLIPILELLWHNKWSNMDGLGALIITPTRELALQIFEVLRKIGRHHDFSAGLIIGGKDISEEQSRIQKTNIIICTPGRLLQHFDETAGFQCDDLKSLILDEADRILDMGFSETMNAIIENLPSERQTLLYSATQTKSVKDLARLSLNKPEYIAVHEHAKYATPKKLLQNYVTVDIDSKINFLYSFIKNHLKSKCIVFLSCCKQVKFIYETFAKLRPGVLLLALYGRQKQMKRVVIYNKFCNSPNAVLFATDIAARGLDFPAVNWVLQYDCPESSDTYIHRVGRTARYEKGGQALLMILKSENSIIDKLKERKVPIHEIRPNPKKIYSIQGKLQSFCAQNHDIKQCAQRSIVSYARSVYLQGDKSIFDVKEIDFEKLATSMGLLAPPKIRFLKKIEKKFGPTESVPGGKSKKKNQKDVDKLGIEVLADRLKKATTTKESTPSFADDNDGEESEDDVLVQKTTNLHHENLGKRDKKEDFIYDKSQKPKLVSKVSMAKKILRKNIKVNTKVVFDEEGEAINPMVDANPSEQSGSDEDVATVSGIDLAVAKEHMEEEDRIDRQRESKRIRGKHQEKKRKERKERRKSTSGGVAMLASDNENEEEEEEIEDIFVAETNEREGSSENEEDNKQPEKKRRKISTQKKKSKKKSQPRLADDDDDDDDEEMGTSLAEDEQLALHLLGVS